MINPWQSPILLDSIGSWLEINDIDQVSFNTDIQTAVMKAFDRFIEDVSGNGLPQSGAHSYGKNEMFYNW